MKRIAYLTDTHLGCGALGYQKQPRYLGQFDELFAALRRWLVASEIELLIHGGDVVDEGTAPQIAAAAELLQSLGVPCAVSLGNHDLSRPDSLALWQRLAPELIGDVTAARRIALEHCDLFLITHHWQPARDFYWQIEAPQQPRLDERQEASLCAAMQASGRPAILVTHAPANAIPAAQTGLPQPMHEPDPLYAATLQRVAASCPNLRLILTGHNHVHTMCDHGAFVSSSTSAFTERPAQLRLMDVDETAITARTVALAALAGLSDEIAPEAAWAIGTTAQHNFVVPL
jgi:DNA repair exonuclease SbcCD nuclease subunit